MAAVTAVAATAVVRAVVARVVAVKVAAMEEAVRAVVAMVAMKVGEEMAVAGTVEVVEVVTASEAKVAVGSGAD